MHTTPEERLSSTNTWLVLVIVIVFLSDEFPPFRKTQMKRWRNTSARTSISRTRSGWAHQPLWKIIECCDCVFFFPWSEHFLLPQSDDPAVQWQLNLYKDVVVKSEEPANPEHSVDRVQSISAAVFHLEQVNELKSNEKNSNKSS